MSVHPHCRAKSAQRCSRRITIPHDVCKDCIVWVLITAEDDRDADCHFKFHDDVLVHRRCRAKSTQRYRAMVTRMVYLVLWLPKTIEEKVWQVTTREIASVTATPIHVVDCGGQKALQVSIVCDIPSLFGR